LKYGCKCCDPIVYNFFLTQVSQNTKTYKDAFALFNKKGNGRIPAEALGDLLRAVGQNPTLAEIDELERNIPGEFDFDTFVKIVNRPDGFKSLGEPEDYIRGFQVFDKDQTGFIGVGELRYILTSLGEKLSDSEVDELLKGVNVTRDGNVNYTGE
jgi:calmodulin